jgi:hypothetical protein
MKRHALFFSTLTAMMLALPAFAADDTSGLMEVRWGKNAFNFEGMPSGPQPLRNLSRLPNGKANNRQLVGDYRNPILTPEAAAVVKMAGLAILKHTFNLSDEVQGVAEEFLAAEILIIRVLDPPIAHHSGVGSGGRPGLSVYTAPNFPSRKRQSIARASFASSWFKSMIWSSRARNKFCPPLSRRSRGRIRSSAPKLQEHRIRAFDSRESRFRFCKEIDRNPKKSGKIKHRISPTSSRRSGLVRVFHSRLSIRSTRTIALAHRTVVCALFRSTANGFDNMGSRCLQIRTSPAANGLDIRTPFQSAKRLSQNYLLMPRTASTVCMTVTVGWVMQ